MLHSGQVGMNTRKVISTCECVCVCTETISLVCFLFLHEYNRKCRSSIDAGWLHCVCVILTQNMHFHNIQLKRWRSNSQHRNKNRQSSLCRMNLSLPDYITNINKLQSKTLNYTNNIQCINLTLMLVVRFRCVFFGFSQWNLVGVAFHAFSGVFVKW